MIKLDSLYFQYPNEIVSLLKDINVSIPKGSFHYIVGKNGIGKSSLLKLISLELAPASGRIKLFGQKTTALSKDKRALLKRKIGLLSQENFLIEHKTVFENIALPLQILKQSNVKGSVLEILKWFELEDKAHMYPNALSGGEQRCVALARTVIHRPQLIIADEPTGNIDSQTSQRLMLLFEELHRLGTTILIATHDQSLPLAYPHPILNLTYKGLSLPPSLKTSESIPFPSFKGVA